MTHSPGQFGNFVQGYFCLKVAARDGGDTTDASAGNLPLEGKTCRISKDGKACAVLDDFGSRVQSIPVKQVCTAIGNHSVATSQNSILKIDGAASATKGR